MVANATSSGICTAGAPFCAGSLFLLTGDIGYSLAAVLRHDDGSLRLRLWPRRWSEQNKDFRLDAGAVPEGRPYAEHPLRRP